MIGQIQKFFSLKPSAFQEESSFKISAHEDEPFGGDSRQTNKLTDILLLYQLTKQKNLYSIL